MRKKLISFVLCIVLGLGAVGMLAGCGGAKGNTIQILLMANSSENKFYEKHFADLSETMDVKIKYTGIASADYYDKLKAEIQGGTTPDMFYVRPSDLRRFIAEGLMSSIEAEVNKQTSVDLSKLYASSITSYRYDKATKKLGTGELYALPKDLSVQQLGYNKTLVQKKSQQIDDAGLKLPWNMDFSKENYTWDEFKTLAKICSDTSDTSKPIYGCDIPNIELLTWSFGGKLLSDDMQNVTVNSEALKKAVRYQADLIKEGAANYEGATYDNFISGKVAFYGETNSYNIKDFEDNFKALDMEWDVMPWPVADSSKPTEWMGKITSAGFALSAKSKMKEKTVEIMLSLVSESVQDKLVSTEKLMLPLYKSVAEQAYISPDYDNVYAPKGRKVFIDVISGRNGKFSDEYKCYDLLWSDPLTQYLETIFAADKNKVDGLIKNDQGYASLQTEMQSAYDRNKNK